MVYSKRDAGKENLDKNTSTRTLTQEYLDKDTSIKNLQKGYFEKNTLRRIRGTAARKKIPPQGVFEKGPSKRMPRQG